MTLLRRPDMQDKLAIIARTLLAVQVILFVIVHLFSLQRAYGATDQDLVGTGLSLCCVVGDVTSSQAIVWLRADAESRVSVHYSKAGDFVPFSSTAPTTAVAETDFTVNVVIDGLEPATRYYYRAVVTGEKAGPVRSFVTAPPPDAWVDVQFAFGGDTRERFQPFSIMDAIRAMRPHFFLFLGDTIYADVGRRARELHEFWTKYAANRRDPPMRRLLAETSVYVTWDDHEVEDNYRPDNPLAPIAHRAFFHYWPIRKEPEATHQLYRSFRWGKALELFILDTRQHRDRVAGTMLGKKQKQWFLEALASSSARFKFVATSVPMLNRKKDSWGSFRAERMEILNYIANKRIRGVTFLTADLHFSAVQTIDNRSGVKEFIVGPLAAPINARGPSEGYEFFYNQSFNYGLVRVHAKPSPPFAEIVLLDSNNRILHKTRIGDPH